MLSLYITKVYSGIPGILPLLLAKSFKILLLKTLEYSCAALPGSLYISERASETDVLINDSREPLKASSSGSLPASIFFYF